MRKKSSTNTLNKKNLEADCGMAYTMAILSGRWKLSILAFLIDGKLRYGELKKKLPAISERMLITQLKELQADGLITRIAYPEIPPRVEYQLTEKGATLKSILIELEKWGELHKEG
ncbi:helix-turn-helix transcriptional regulator [Fulvivirga ulvae]|uniref:winged helix-turn-helix transcriptional regulator n=1 Tax=Fulvivirga ulvae TaxID=2904245 RepID=UPI001F3D9583|nr:helix-turn-helix domain-containing protein [Fulvivirga ulvae]UII31410.1 helix-turn-helix transcriptional regulator [Fulvivirga ulvae]